MKKKKEETIFALSTPYGQSAIAVIRISGSMCKTIVKKFCKVKNSPRRAFLQNSMIKKKL